MYSLWRASDLQMLPAAARMAHCSGVVPMQSVASGQQAMGRGKILELLPALLFQKASLVWRK